MVDVQNTPDIRGIPLTKVGVKGLEYPITVLDRVNKVQHTTARADLFADLPRHFKGTHMSRFVEIFHRHRKDLSMPRFLEMLEEIIADLDAESAYGTLDFPYFLEKQAPVSRLPGIMSYNCRYQGRVDRAGNQAAGPAGFADAAGKAGGGNTPAGNALASGKNAAGLRRHFTVSVSVPVATVCPCSRAISERGAHNQRGIVTVELELGPFFLDRGYYSHRGKIRVESGVFDTQTGR
jgi:GTP cyclohydrolase I